jgi:hypothetical protein
MEKTKEELGLELVVAQAELADLEARQSGELSNAISGVEIATTAKDLLLARQAIQLSYANRNISDIEQKIAEIAVDTL